MSSAPLTFHHFGLAASNPEKALEFLSALGYLPKQKLRDPLQNVDIILCEHPTAPVVEVVSPTDTPGPLDNMLKEQKQLIYHVCYETPELESALSFLKEKGIRCQCISPPTPAILFDNKLVSFYFVRGFGLIEILETA